MATVDLTTSSDKGYPAPSGLIGAVQYIAREFLGSEFTGATTDTHKVLKVNANQLITNVRCIVTDVDNSASSVDIGYTDGTNTSATHFSSAVDLTTATKVVAVVSDKQLLCALDTWITIITNDTLESDTRFILIMEVIDLTNKQGETLTAPIANA
jgi:hypothetical protein